MRHPAVFTLLSMAFLLAALASPAQGQAAFKVPFKFESGGKKFPAGDYVVIKSGDGQLAFQQLASGKETAVPFTQPLPPPSPAVAEPRLVFDEVGNFEPSYTEYFTRVRAGRGLAVRVRGIPRPRHEGRAQEPGCRRRNEEEVDGRNLPDGARVRGTPRDRGDSGGIVRVAAWRHESLEQGCQFGGRRPLSGVARHGPADERVETGGDAGTERGQRRRLGRQRQERDGEMPAIRRVERQPAAQHPVHDHAEAVDVGPAVARLPVSRSGAMYAGVPASEPGIVPAEVRRDHDGPRASSTGRSRAA